MICFRDLDYVYQLLSHPDKNIQQTKQPSINVYKQFQPLIRPDTPSVSYLYVVS